MPSLAPSAAALAAELAAPRRSPYDEVHVLLIMYKKTARPWHFQNLTNVQRFCHFFGYQTKVVYADDEETKAAPHKRGRWPPVPQHGPESSNIQHCGVFEAFHDMVCEHDEDCGQKHLIRRKLLVACYFGHGSVKETDVYSDMEWLYGVDGRRGFSISWMEEFARDNCASCDVLFMNETCFGGWNGTMNDEMGMCNPWKLCEVIPAGHGGQVIYSNFKDRWSRRVVNTAMAHFVYGLTVKELSDIVIDETITKAPGYYEQMNLPLTFEDPNGSTDESILLAPLPGSPAAQAADWVFFGSLG